MLLDPMGSVTEGDDAVLAQSELGGKEEKDAMSNVSDIDSTTDSNREYRRPSEIGLPQQDIERTTRRC